VGPLRPWLFVPLDRAGIERIRSGLRKASIASSRLLDECSYDEGDASYDEDGGEDDRECGHCLNASSKS
jgi:hypothetical protein